MVRPGLVELPHPVGDGGGVPPGDDGVDQSVATGSAEVLVGVAQATEVVGVVGQAQVALGVAAGGGPGSRGVGLQHHGQLRCLDQTRMAAVCESRRAQRRSSCAQASRV